MKRIDLVLQRIDLVLQLADMKLKLEAAEARIAELEARLGPRPWCADCRHPLADYHEIIGCQHLTPVYIAGFLRHHDKCRCRCRKGL